MSRVIEHAAKINNVSRGLPGLRRLPQDLLRVDQQGREVRPVGAAAPGATPAAPAQRDEQRGGRGDLVRGDRPADPGTEVAAAAPQGPRGGPLGLGRREGAAPPPPGHRPAADRRAGLADRDRTGQLTDAAMEGPFGFCMYASTAGQVVSLDTFYVGRLKGIGAVWQLTAVDVATRTRGLPADRRRQDRRRGRSCSSTTSRRRCASTASPCQGVLTDNGPEFIGKAFQTRAAELGLVHHRIPPRSPNHNSVCERFHGTVLARVLPTPLPPRPRRRHHPARPVAADLARATTTSTVPTTATTWPAAPR